MQIIIDIDGTICSEERQFSRSLATPNEDAIESINTLYDQGHTIILYSARTWAEWEMTSHWLRQHQIKYHQLFLGKPVGDVWIDDRAIRHEKWSETMKMLTNLKK